MNSERVILHVDMDMFYVAVELRERPELRGKPVVVGGAGPRGVIAAASYEARRFGVFSAMGSVHAQRLCPDVVFLPGNFPLYQEVSTDVHAIFHSVTPYVEGLALDEAFLDVTGSLKIFGTAKDIAHLIRERITTEIGIPCSVGIATNKFIAKIASKAAKPIATAEGVREGKGVVQVVSGSELSFLHPLPMKSLWGVGPVTQEKLDRIGMKTIGDLAALPLHVLTVAVGEAHGRHLHDLSHGRDDRPVESERDVKSIGHEETFNEDLFTYEEVHRHLVRLCDAVASRLRAHHTLARTLTLKVKFSDFHSITRSITAGGGKSSGPSLVDALTPLLKNINLAPGVRLLGVSTTNFTDERAQPSLFDEDQVRDDSWDQASEAIDHIREKFGKGAIRPGSAL
jgi:DNA polymerase IV